MDIVGKESLEAMLRDFPGSVLFVSHDRYFIKQIADSLLVFEDDEVKFLPYGYEEYLERKNGTYAANVDREIFAAKEAQAKAAKAAAEAAKLAAAPVQVQKGKESYALGKEISRLEKKVKKAEEQVAVLEDALEAKKAELLLPEYASSYSKLSEISAQVESLEMDLLTAMEEWEALEQQLSELTQG